MLHSRPVASEKPKPTVSIGDKYPHPNGELKVVDLFRDGTGKKMVSYTLNGHGDRGQSSLEHFIQEYVRH